MRKEMYDPLGSYFDGLETGQVKVRLAFGQVEGILRAPLPTFAFVRRVCWANDWRQSHSVAWLPAGWRVRHVRPVDHVVNFERTG